MGTKKVKDGWNPYLAGALTGLLAIASVWITTERLRSALQEAAANVHHMPHFPEMAFSDESPLSSLSLIQSTKF